MKVTSIRTNKNQIPSTDTLLKLEKALKHAFKKAGFISNAEALSRTSMKIGLHMCSFRIDTSIHGHNKDYGYYGSTCKAGYKLTNLPTWEQRENFNHLVNDIFDKFKLSARIMSGNFEVRYKIQGRRNEWSAFASAYNGGNRLFQIKSA